MVELIPFVINISRVEIENYYNSLSWWRHQMKTFSALLAFCAVNSPVPAEVLAQRPVTRSFDVFFDLRLNKRLSKQSRSWLFETLSSPLWRHSNVFKSYSALSQTSWPHDTRTHPPCLYDVLSCMLTLLDLARNIPGEKHSGYHCYSCPGSLSRQVTRSHSIDYAG